MTLQGRIDDAEVRQAVVKWLKDKYGLDVSQDQLRLHYPEYDSPDGYEWDQEPKES
jgi:hypothetical protein